MITTLNVENMLLREYNSTLEKIESTDFKDFTEFSNACMKVAETLAEKHAKIERNYKNSQLALLVAINSRNLAITEGNLNLEIARAVWDLDSMNWN